MTAKGRTFGSIREAIHHTATACGVPMKSLAADLDLSPSNLSMRTTLGEDGIPFPADDRLVKIQRLTGDVSILNTMADALGYELRPKTDRVPDLIRQVIETQDALHRQVEQLKLSVPLMDAVIVPKRGKP